MKRVTAAISALTVMAIGLTLATEASAQRARTEPAPYLTEHPKSGTYRRKSGPQVRGYFARRGGYSYTYGDSVNTYGDSRSVYGATQAFRNFNYDRQTTSGPFDHGFFFDSAVAPRGGDAPYMH